MNVRKTEIWKTIPGFSTYQASSFGRLKTFNWKNQGMERIMRPAVDEKGYYRTMLIDDFGRTRTVKVHRIIAKTFIENPLGKKEVNHIDGIKTNNCVENLEWATRSENMKHAFSAKLCLPPVGRTVINSLTGERYISCSEAARANNMPKSTLQSMLSGYRENKTLFIYEC